MEKMDTHRHGARYVATNGEGIRINCNIYTIGKQKKHIDDFYLFFAKNHPIISF